MAERSNGPMRSNVPLESRYNRVRFPPRPETSELRSIFGGRLKTRVCPSAPHSVYQAIAFAQYYTPIRGTLGLFQGVVFESDFCHTNFRTTVAYDKFTNNF